jgi:hypothetical protein
MLDFVLHRQPTSTAMDSTKNDRIKAAMDQLDSQKVLNYAAADRDHYISSMTLARRYRAKPSLGQKPIQLTVNASMMSKRIRFYDILIL